jgi:signal transduction histidine kinase
MLNLMLNGMQAAAVGDDTREVRITTAVRHDAIEVAVTDTGRGFDPDVGERIFAPFFTTKLQGLGLGLAISRSIIECHGGQLWATSRPGTGATFRFSLPLRVAS